MEVALSVPAVSDLRLDGAPHSDVRYPVLVDPPVAEGSKARPLVESSGSRRTAFRNAKVRGASTGPTPRRPAMGSWRIIVALPYQLRRCVQGQSGDRQPGTAGTTSPHPVWKDCEASLRRRRVCTRRCQRGVPVPRSSGKSTRQRSSQGRPMSRCSESRRKVRAEQLGGSISGKR